MLMRERKMEERKKVCGGFLIFFGKLFLDNSIAQKDVHNLRRDGGGKKEL